MASEIDIPLASLQTYIQTLEKLGFLSVHKNNTGKIIKVEEHMPRTEDSILKIAGETWLGDISDLNISLL